LPKEDEKLVKWIMDRWTEREERLEMLKEDWDGGVKGLQGL
jgi:hypothetical protein